MDPNQQPSGGNPYEFIMSSGQPSKSTISSPDGGDMRRRILIAAIAGSFLIIAAILVFTFLSNSNKGNEETLLTIAKQQAELIRIGEAGTTKAKGPAAQNLAITTKLSISTVQKDFLSFAGKQGVKIDPKAIASPNAKNDSELSVAEQNNKYDEVLTAMINKQLTDYTASLKKAYNETESKSGKEVLSNAFQQAELLLGKPAQAPTGLLLLPATSS